jgi:hypothetical protein
MFDDITKHDFDVVPQHINFSWYLSDSGSIPIPDLIRPQISRISSHIIMNIFFDEKPADFSSHLLDNRIVRYTYTNNQFDENSTD